MKKIVILDGFCLKQTDLNFDKIFALGDVTYYDRTPNDQIIERIGDAEILVTNKKNIDKSIIDACPSLKFIAVLATGYNIIDCEYARSKGVLVSNVPAYSTDSVVQHTFALLFALVSKVGEYNYEVHNGDWERCADFCFYTNKMQELSNKIFGIIGYGNIGKKVAKVADALGMKVMVYNRTPFEGSVSLDEVFASGDIISLHCPLTASNSKMINSATIEKMKNTAIIINTARGGLIDDNDLAEALNTGRIGGAGLDVLTNEPPKDNPLLSARNCIITPHVAWATLEARSRLLSVTEDNIKGYINGNPINIVN